MAAPDFAIKPLRHFHSSSFHLVTPTAMRVSWFLLMAALWRLFSLNPSPQPSLWHQQSYSGFEAAAQTSFPVFESERCLREVMWS